MENLGNHAGSGCSSDVNCCRLTLRIFLGVQSRELAMSIPCIPEVGHLFALRIGLFFHTMHFLLFHSVRQFSSQSFSTETRAGPVFEVYA